MAQFLSPTFGCVSVLLQNIICGSYTDICKGMRGAEALQEHRQDRSANRRAVLKVYVCGAAFDGFALYSAHLQSGNVDQILMSRDNDYSVDIQQ